MLDEAMAVRLKAGDEAAFREVVAEFGGRLARLARSFSRNDAVIEEAVQETWLAVIRGIDGFEGRSPLRHWIFGILVNQARRLAVREHRQAQLARGANPGPPRADAPESEEREPGMGAHGMWLEPPTTWGMENPESVFLTRETLQVLERALAELTEAQRQVVLLRDVERMSPEEVCNILELNDTNQRVLLHRGRARVRRALDAYVKDGARSAPTQRAGGR